MNRFRILLFCSILFSFKTSSVSALSDDSFANHRSYLGPQAYHLKRTKVSGTKQKGWLYGIYGAYERRPDNGFYWFLEGYWSGGVLNGETSKGSVLKSWSNEYKVDGRFGYSFCLKNWKKLTLVPYLGYGYLNSTNDFKHPTAQLFHFTDEFDYASAGSQILFFPYGHTELGVSAEVDFMMQGTSTIRRDPKVKKHSLKMSDRNQYELDLWYRRHWSYKGKAGWLLISPFYQYRNYGGRCSMRYDFIETEFEIYGLRLLLNVSF